MKKHIKISLFIIFSILGTLFIANNISATSYNIIKLDHKNSPCAIYPKAEKKNSITSFSSFSSRDVPLLETSGNFQKIRISGLTGWINKNDCKGSVVSVDKLDTFVFSTGGKAINGLDVSRYQVVGNKLYFGLVYGSGYTTHNIGYTNVPKGLSNNKAYYSYDGVYYYADYKKMMDDYRKNTSTNAANKNDPYYDYYQYLPLRSTSKLTSSNFNSYLKAQRSDAAQTMNGSKTFNLKCSGNDKDNKTLKHSGTKSILYNKGSRYFTNQNSIGVNASILYGISLNESAYGTSNFSLYYKNPFGWGAVDSCPNKATIYSSIDNAIDKYFLNMSNGYANPTDWRGGMGTHLGNKKSGANVKYATDPHWGYKAAYNYRRLDEKGSNKDKNIHALGILNPAKAGVVENTYLYTQAKTSSAKTPWYYERNGASLIILGESGDFYKVQNDTKPKAASVYIQKSKIHLVGNTKFNTSNESNSNTSATTKVSYSVDKDGKNAKIWGRNNAGQLGNGNTKDVNDKAKIDLNKLVNNEKIKKVLISSDNKNVFILTDKGNVFSSGSNAYLQRSFNSKENKFNKVNPSNISISEIKYSNNRLRMKVKGATREYLYVGSNVFNTSTRKNNVKTKYPIKLKFNSNDVAINAWVYDYNINKVKTLYTYSNKKLVKKTNYFYNKDKSLKQKNIYEYKNGKKTKLTKLMYSKGLRTYKYEYYYVNNKLKSTNAKKATRYKTTYNKKGKSSKTIVQTYSKTGKLGTVKLAKLR